MYHSFLRPSLMLGNISSLFNFHMMECIAMDGEGYKGLGFAPLPACCRGILI